MTEWVQVMPEHVRKLQPGTRVRLINGFTKNLITLYVLCKNGRTVLGDENGLTREINDVEQCTYEISI